MRTILLAALALSTLFFAGCRTQLAFGHRGPVVAPKGWSPGVAVAPEDCCCRVDTEGSGESGGCCSSDKPFEGKPVWKFWGEGEQMLLD